MANVNEKLETFQCSSCEKERKASFWCKDCSKALLCFTCKYYHSRSETSSHHNVLSLAEVHDSLLLLNKLQIRSYCTYHPRELIYIYCRRHKIFCCPICVRLHHDKCDGLQATDQHSNIKVIIDQDVNSISELCSKIKIHVDNERAAIQQQKQKYLGHVSFLESQTRALKEKLDNELLEQTQLLQTEFTNVTRTREENISRLIKLTEDLNTHRSLLQFSEHYSSCQNVMAQHKSLGIVQSQVEKTMQCLEKDILEMHLKMGDAVENYLKEGKLCSISISKQKADFGEFLTQCKRTVDTLALHQNSQSTAQAAIEPKSLISCNLEFKTEIPRSKVKAGYCTPDATYLPDDTMLLCDKNKDRLIKLGDNSKTTKLIVKGSPSGICVSSDGQHVLVVLNGKKVASYSLHHLWEEVKCFDIEEYACGIACHGNKIVTGHKDCVVIYDLMGSQVARVSKSKCDWTYPALSHDGSMLYHKDGNIIVCRKMEDVTQVVWRYSSPQLNNPCGIDIDRDGNILIVEYDLRNIHQVSKDGTLGRVIVDKLHSITYPLGLCYNKNKGILAVTSFMSAVMSLFVDEVYVEFYTFKG